jgi:aryl-alcohol dehydrogenase-like predicted oxidoreductase
VHASRPPSPSLTPPQHFGVGMLPWSPLARGMVTHPLDVNTTRTQTDAFTKAYDAGPATAAVVQRCVRARARRTRSRRLLLTAPRRTEEIAKKNGLSMAQVALAWIMNKSPVTAPIVGTTSLKNLEEIIGAYARARIRAACLVGGR